MIVIRARRFQARYVEMLVPVVGERLRQYEAGEYRSSDQVRRRIIKRYYHYFIADADGVCRMIFCNE